MSPIYAQAWRRTGQSIFISAGDDGAAGIIFNGSACVPGTSRNINELGGDPNVTQVGGTRFNPNFDASGNNVGHVPEAAWDDEISDPPNGGATGGGASVFYSKPAYQKGTGVPADGKRDVPDVALIASALHPGVFLGFISGGSCCKSDAVSAAPVFRRRLGRESPNSSRSSSTRGWEPSTRESTRWLTQGWPRRAFATSPPATTTSTVSRVSTPESAST